MVVAVVGVDQTEELLAVEELQIVVVAGSKKGVEGEGLLEVLALQNEVAISHKVAIEGVATTRGVGAIGVEDSIEEDVAVEDVVARQWPATKQWKHPFFTQTQRQRLLPQDRKSRPESRRLA